MIELVTAAFGVFARYTGRSLLTILGLAIGVSAFIAMVSFGEGARRSVVSQFEALGVDILKVSSELDVRQSHGRQGQPLVDADIEAIRHDAIWVSSVIPVIRKSVDVSQAGSYHLTMVYGTSPRFADAHDWQIGAGGMLDETDVARRARVCVLGETVARSLFGTGEPLGKTVTLGAVTTCRVIGLLAPKGHATNGNDLDDIVIIPFTTHTTYFGSTGGYSYLEVEPTSPQALDAARQEVIDILRRRHRIGPSDFDDFKVSSPREVVRAADRTSRILSGLLSGIAAVSLLVGGIGIMNIQLVAVAERTREIGIRAAIGASPRQILALFLSEALGLSTVGALLGVLVGFAVSTLVASRMGWPRVISASGMIGAALFGVGVGVLFGFLPARRAATLEPIESLRHE